MDILSIMFGVSMCIIAFGLLVGLADAKRKNKKKAGLILVAGGVLSALIELIFINNFL